MSKQPLKECGIIIHEEYTTFDQQLKILGTSCNTLYQMGVEAGSLQNYLHTYLKLQQTMK